MENILVFIVGVIMGGVVVWVWFDKKYKELEREVKRTQGELEKQKDVFDGIEEYNKKVVEIKNGRKNKILEKLGKDGKIDAGDAADLFDVSRYTAFRYLEELQKDGKIEQVGTFGRSVKYKVK